MRVALIGATGNAGSRVLNELLSRGHEVTGICRHPEKLAPHPRVTPRGVDGSGADLSAAIRGHDAVISAARFADLDPDILVPAVKASGVRRYLVVGGAGSLMHPDGVLEVDKNSGMPAPAQANSRRGGYLLGLLRQSEGLDWTYISPSRYFRAGERTGKFRYGKDHVLLTEEGEPTSISYEDMALAIVDELEKPQHIGERITIGY